MKWSKYNFAFSTSQNDYLLYNALSNSFVEMNKSTFQELEKIQRSPETYDFSRNLALYIQLKTMKALVDEQEEESLINVLRLNRLSQDFSTNRLALTIAPTLACNFDCFYCYEKFRRPVYMGNRVMEQLIRFAKKYTAIKYLSITWFGGEPTLCFDKICWLTRELEQLNIPLTAAMITNGYLLTPEKIDQLTKLKIRFIQITIDGLEKTHDKRRVLLSGEKTYSKIVANMKYLMENWEGRLNIRVNVDKTNDKSYYQTWKFFKNKFKNKKVHIYPGIVRGEMESNPDYGCLFSKEDEAVFSIKQYRQYGVTDLQYYPKYKSFGCAATMKNAFVIGPEGEIYKCWNDMGDKEMIVGSIFENKPWNTTLLANYMVGSDRFNDATCRSCFFLPVCDGGCPNLRLKNKFYQAKYDPCVKFRKNLKDLLEVHYEIKKQNKTE